MSSFDPTLELKPTVVRRLEVITDFGGRRNWPPEVKGEIMLEALSPGAVISEVARRHGVRPQQLFGWLREARKVGTDGPGFVPVVVEAGDDPPSVAAPVPSRRKRAKRSGDAAIEVEIDGVTVRIGRGAEARTVAVVIQALKAGR